MPKFCPNCGAKLAFENAKFCGECGFVLQARADSEEIAQEVVPQESPDEEEEKEDLRVSIFELGNRLEEVVEKIFKAKGFETERRKRLEGKSGTRSEIDMG